MADSAPEESSKICFVGLRLFPFGLLVYKSRFLPRVAGLADDRLLRLGADKPVGQFECRFRPVHDCA
jgi:hypothetical protein